MLKIIKNKVDNLHYCDLSCSFLRRDEYNEFTCNKNNLKLQKFNEEQPNSFENCGGLTNEIL